MERLKVEAVVTAVKKSAVRPDVSYVTAETKGWGVVKYATTRKTIKVGDTVVLTDQKHRNQADRIRWQEDRR